WVRKVGGGRKRYTWKTREEDDLLNSCLALKPAHILHDLINIRRSHAFDLRHVAELPMMRCDAIGRSSLEGRIHVMVRLIDLMHQWRSVVGSSRLFPMTGCTGCIKSGFARLKFYRHRAAPDRLYWL